jgi:hypothetical protein
MDKSRVNAMQCKCRENQTSLSLPASRSHPIQGIIQGLTESSNLVHPTTPAWLGIGVNNGIGIRVNISGTNLG